MELSATLSSCYVVTLTLFYCDFICFFFTAMKVYNWKFSQLNASCHSQSEPVTVVPARGPVSLSICPIAAFRVGKYHEISKSDQNWNFPIDWKNMSSSWISIENLTPIYNKWVPRLAPHKRDFHPRPNRYVNMRDPQSSLVSSVGPLVWSSTWSCPAAGVFSTEAY